MPAFLSNGLFISEVFADNVGGSGFDTDGDGGVNKADEYVEIQNAGSGPSVSLEGIQIWSAKRGLLYDFPDGDSVANGSTATVVGQYDGAEPPGFYDAGLPDNNSNQGFLEDGENANFDTLYLVDTTTGEYVSFAYGLPPQTQALPPGFTGTTLVGSESLATGFPNGVPVGRNADGDFEELVTPTPGTPGPVCFASGTQISTPEGERAVETLGVGDLVTTMDNGDQPIRWIGKSRMAASGKFAPVVIRAGFLGNARDLVVSQQHKVLVKGAQVDLLFAQNAVLCAAKHLVDDKNVIIREGGFVEYYHVMFDEHEIIYSEGAPTESFYLGDTALSMVDDPTADELLSLFPELRRRPQAAFMPLRQHEAKALFSSSHA